MGRMIAFPNVRPSEAEFELMPGVVSHRSSAGPSAAQFLDRGTDYWRIRLRFEHLANEEKAAVLAWHSATRGGAIPFYLDDQTQTFCGTLPNTCIVPQSSMWISASPDVIAKVELGRLRAIRRGGVSGVGLSPTSDGVIAFVSPMTPFATYAIRVDHSIPAVVTNTAGLQVRYDGATSIIAGRIWLAVNTRYADSLTYHSATSTHLAVTYNFLTLPGEERYAANFFVHRAPVVDNGENLLSNNVVVTSATLLGSAAVPNDITLNHSWFPSIAGGIHASARIIEGVTSGEHRILWRAAKDAEEHTYWLRGRVRRGDGTTLRGLRIAFSDTATAIGQMAIGVASANFAISQSSGFSETTGWLSDLRGTAATTGWLEFAMRTRTNTAASIQLNLSLTSGGGAHFETGYAGNSSSVGIDGFTIGRALGYENFRTDYGRIVQTSGAAVSSGAQQPHGTSRLYFKGAPSSQSQLAAASALFTVGHELHRLTSDVMTDAAGTGVMEFEPPLRNASVHHAPICFYRPYGFFKATRPPKIVEEFGVYITMDLELEEVCQ